MGFKHCIINDCDIANNGGGEEPHVLEYDDNDVDDEKYVVQQQQHHHRSDEAALCETIQDYIGAVDHHHRSHHTVSSDSDAPRFPHSNAKSPVATTLTIYYQYNYDSLTDKFSRFNVNCAETERAAAMERARIDNICNERKLLSDLEKRLALLRSTATLRFSF